MRYIQGENKKNFCKTYEIPIYRQMEYLKEILKSRSGASSKRLISIFLILNIIAMSWISIFTPYKIEEYLFESLVFLAGGVIGLTTSEKFIKNNGKQTEDV